MLSANTSAAAAAPAVHQFSSLSSPSSISPFADLPPIQAQVAAALAEGSTVSAAAQQAGVHRTTVHHWLRTVPAFARAVDQARKDYRNQLADEIAELETTALSTLRALLDSPETPASVRLKAALAILQRPRFPDRGWSLPCAMESPTQQEFAQDLALIQADYKRMRMTEAMEQAAPAHSDSASPVVPGTNAEPPRNAPCPCGSGLKYKRCCRLTKSTPMTS